MDKNLSQARPATVTGKTGAEMTKSAASPLNQPLQPTEQASIEEQEADADARFSIDKDNQSGPTSTPPRVMIIDDSKTIRRSAQSLLAREGWDVVTAEDGFEALAKVVEHRPDIVFVDIMMPRLDGYQTCALIKNNAAFSSTPVIMLSSKDSIFDKARGRVVGSEHYLTKPFTREDLLGTIDRHLPEFGTNRTDLSSKEA